MRHFLLAPLRRLLRPLLLNQERMLIAVGQLHARLVQQATYPSIHEAEFTVFSQCGEDGIIQYILGKVPIEDRTFIEIGVQDYSESNTRFLLQGYDWSGLIIDAGTDHDRFLSNRELRWRHQIEAQTEFITRENVNDVISRAGYRGDIGLLSIDIDGNDYWVFSAIDVVSPRILVLEYNSTFGRERAVTVPYAADFQRTAAHYSNLYFGASLPALCRLAAEKGYTFVGSNRMGTNAFFVRTDVSGGLRPLTPQEGYVTSRFRESRDPAGALTYVADHAARLSLISHLPLHDVERNVTKTVAELLLSGR